MMGALATALPPTAEQLIDLTSAMKTHGGRESPAPHKPLLVLWAIWRRAVDPDGSRLFSYQQSHDPMVQLLIAAGRGNNPRPWYPFVRLRTAPFWELSGQVITNAAGDVSSARSLAGTRAGFRTHFDDCLLDGDVAGAVVGAVAAAWLPEPTRDSLNDLARDLAGSH